MSSETTFKLRFEGSDGKYYSVDLSNPEHVNWLHQRLGICSFKARIQELERKVEDLEKPVRQQKILELLKNEVSGRTEGWIKRRVPKFCYSDLSGLKAQGKLVSFRVGNCWKYRLAEYGEGQP